MTLDTLNKYHEEGWLIKQTHPTLPLTIWNYSSKTQYEQKWDNVTLQCRGLVTHDYTARVVARPFKKFFNWEEKKHTPTDTFDVYEKMDGSLIILFHTEGQWVAASRGSFTSEQAITAQRIVDQWSTELISTGITYLFELVAPWNRVVVRYDEEKLVLLGAIHTESGSDADYSVLDFMSKQLECDLVKKYDGIKDYNILKEMISDDREGYVVKFSNGERIKIKGEEYLRLHKIMTNVSTTSVWEYLSQGRDIEKLLVDVPDEFYQKIKDYANNLKLWYFTVQQECGLLLTKILNGNKGNRKEFAENVKLHPKEYWGVLFKMYDNAPYSELIWKLIKPEFEKL